MTEENEELVRVEIRTRFYYIQFPNALSTNLWQDRAGELHYISEMGIDHLKNTIKLVEKDIKYLDDSHRPRDVIAAIMPVAMEKLASLRAEFKRKAVI